MQALHSFVAPSVQGKFFPLLFKRQFLAIFVPNWTSNCYVIIEYTENLIKPSYSSLKTVLDRVPALVPKFKIDRNMLFLSLTSLTKKQAEQHSKIQSILSIQSHMEHTSTC